MVAWRSPHALTLVTIPLAWQAGHMRTAVRRLRRALRDLFGELEKEHPHLKETMLSAMGNVDTSRLLDPRFLDLEQTEERQAEKPELFPILTEG